MVPKGSGWHAVGGSASFQCLIPESPTPGWGGLSSLQALGGGDGVNPMDVCAWKLPLGSPCTGSTWEPPRQSHLMVKPRNHRIFWI